MLQRFGGRFINQIVSLHNDREFTVL